jgi:hypothetical protein
VLLKGQRFHKIIAISILPVLVVELLPKPIPTTQIEIPTYVHVLRGLPGDGVLDALPVSFADISRQTEPRDLVHKLCSWTQAMYHQTTHHKRMAFGYVPRVPTSVTLQDDALAQAFINQEFELLWKKYRIRYLVVSNGACAFTAMPANSVRGSPFVKLLYEDDICYLLELGASHFPPE